MGVIKSSFILLILTILYSCKEKVCSNKYQLISTADNIPVLQLNISKHPDTLLNELNKRYGADLSQRCDWVDFKMPFEIQDKQGYLKVMVDFSEIGKNCPIHMRLKNRFNMLLNANNQLLAEDEPLHIKNLPVKIEKYLQGLKEETFQNIFCYQIAWTRQTDPQMVNALLTSIYTAHLSFIEKQVQKEGLDFCTLDNKQLLQVKDQYPLRIALRIKSPYSIPSLKEVINYEQKQLQINLLSSKYPFSFCFDIN